MLTFKEVETDSPTKVQDLEEPIVGVFKGTEEGKYNPIYLIETEDRVRKITGVIDLIQKMEKIEVGSTVEIGFKETTKSDDGTVKHHVIVRVAQTQ